MFQPAMLGDPGAYLIFWGGETTWRMAQKMGKYHGFMAPWQALNAGSLQGATG